MVLIRPMAAFVNLASDQSHLHLPRKVFFEAIWRGKDLPVDALVDERNKFSSLGSVFIKVCAVTL